VRLRSRADMTRFLAGLELVEPGLVTVPEWRPEASARRPAQLIPLYGRGLTRVSLGQSST